MPTGREKFNRIIMVCRKCAALCGGDIFAENFKYSWLTWLTIFLIFLYFCLAAYTAHHGLNHGLGWTIILEAGCTLTLAITGLAKLLGATNSKNRKGFLKLYNTIDNAYDIYEKKKNSAYKIALNRGIMITTKVLKCNALAYVLAGGFIFSAPVFTQIVFNVRFKLLPIILPAIDISTDTGYLVTSIYHVICFMFAAFGNFAGDLLFFVLCLNIPVLKDILRIKFEDLNEVLMELKNNPKADVMQNSDTTSLLLNDIIKMHQEYSDYTQTLGDLYFIVIFAQVCVTAVSIGVTAFITVFVGTFPGGYALMIYYFAVLYAYCGLGTITEISNDRLCNDVYSTCLWYELPIKEQRMLIVMLMKAQRPTVLTVGSVLPLSVSTALALTKSIFSFMMMLFSLSEEG